MIATLGIEVFLDKQCFVVDPFVHYDYVLVRLVLYRFPFFLAFLLVPGTDIYPAVVSQGATKTQHIL